MPSKYTQHLEKRGIDLGLDQELSILFYRASSGQKDAARKKTSEQHQNVTLIARIYGFEIFQKGIKIKNLNSASIN